MALPASSDKIDERRSTQRSKAARGVALVAAAALALACAVVVVCLSHNGRRGSSPSVELVQGGPGETGRKLAKICFGTVCATTSAAFAKVLEGTEETIYAKGERRGIQKVEEMEQHGTLLQLGQQQKQQQQQLRVHHVQEAPNSNDLDRQLAHREREDFRSHQRSQQNAKPSWHSEWHRIFGNHG